MLCLQVYWRGIPTSSLLHYVLEQLDHRASYSTSSYSFYLLLAPNYLHQVMMLLSFLPSFTGVPVLQPVESHASRRSSVSQHFVDLDFWNKLQPEPRKRGVPRGGGRLFLSLAELHCYSPFPHLRATMIIQVGLFENCGKAQIAASCGGMKIQLKKSHGTTGTWVLTKIPSPYPAT